MKTKKPVSHPPAAPVVVRFPEKVIVALDRAADKNGGSRSSEVRRRIMQSLKREAAA